MSAPCRAASSILASSSAYPCAYAAFTASSIRALRRSNSGPYLRLFLRAYLSSSAISRACHWDHWKPSASSMAPCLPRLRIIDPSRSSSILANALAMSSLVVTNSPAIGLVLQNRLGIVG